MLNFTFANKVKYCDKFKSQIFGNIVFKNLLIPFTIIAINGISK